MTEKEISGSDLKTLPMFSALTSEDLEVVRDRFTERVVPAGQEVIRQGEDLDHLFVVLQGSVKISRHRADGREVILAVLGAGGVVGDELEAAGVDHSSSVAALEDTRLLSIRGEMFRSLLDEVPALQRGFIQSLIRRLHLAEARQETLASLDVEGRVARVLLVLAQDHGEPKAGGGVRIRIPFTQNEVAAMTGASRVRVNQVISKFRSKGWITVDGGRRTSVQDFAQLRKRGG